MMPDADKPLTDVQILEEQMDLTLEALCRACGTQAEQLVVLVEEGVIAPTGIDPAHWLFTGVHLRRARIAVRLQRDLGVNAAGAALALQLMEEVEELRAQLRAMGAWR